MPPTVEVIVSDWWEGELFGSKVGSRGWCGINAKKGVRLGGHIDVNQEHLL